MDKKYVVRLSREQRVLLEAPVKRAKAAGYKILHPHLLLKTDAEGPASSDVEVAEAFGCHSRTVANVRQRFVEAGLEAALGRKKREFPQRQRKLDGPGGARLIALICGQPPKGQARWTLQLLADRLVALGIVDAISGQTVRRTLKKAS